MPLLARLHLIVGAVTLVAFLVSGMYMRWHDPPVSQLNPGLYLMFLSRHIYVLAAALVHLVLGVYARPAETRWRLRVQWLGSALLIVAAVLLITAFVYEPVSRRARTAVSAYGLYSLFGGTALHVIAGRRSRIAAV